MKKGWHWQRDIKRRDEVFSSWHAELILKHNQFFFHDCEQLGHSCISRPGALPEGKLLILMRLIYNGYKMYGEIDL